MKEQVEWLTVAVVAKRMNTTSLNVLMHIKRGLLLGVEEDSIWMVDGQSLDALLAKTGGDKAEDLCASSCTNKHACSGGCR